MARYAILIYGDDNGNATSSQDLGAHDRHAADLIASGAMVAAVALASREDTATVRDGVVTDGPFTETKEFLAGIAVVEAVDHDAALAIARQNPATWQGGAVEVRPIVGSYLQGSPTSSAE